MAAGKPYQLKLSQILPFSPKKSNAIWCAMKYNGEMAAGKPSQLKLSQISPFSTNSSNHVIWCAMKYTWTQKSYRTPKNIKGSQTIWQVQIILSFWNIQSFRDFRFWINPIVKTWARQIHQIWRSHRLIQFLLHDKQIVLENSKSKCEPNLILHPLGYYTTRLSSTNCANIFL